jgi:subfamily B ATP-binding cassette protein MsbA
VLTAHSEEVGLGAKCFEVCNDAGTVFVSGDFSGNNKDIHVDELMLRANEVKSPRGNMRQSVGASISKLLLLGKPHWPTLAISFIFMVVLGMATGLLAFLMGPAIQFVLSGGAEGLSLLSRYWPEAADFPREKLAWLLPGVAIVVGAMKGLAYLGQFYFSGWFGALMVSDLRKQFFLSALQLSPSQTSRLQLGDLLSRFSADIAAVEAAATWTIASWLRDSIQVVVLLCVAFFLSWQLSLGLCLAVPLIVFPAIRWMRKLVTRMRESQVGQGVVAAQVSQSLETLRSLQAYGAEAFEQARFEKCATQTSKALTHAAWTRAKGPALMEVFIAVVLAVVLAGVGSFSWLETEVLLSFVATLLLLYHPAKELGRLSQLAIPAITALERISAVSPKEEREERLSSGAPLLRMEEGIIFEDVHFSWGGKQVLEGFTFKIPYGGVTALVGQSGGGKSTVIHLLMGFERAQKGRILVGGVPLEELPLQEIRSKFALVTQEAMLFSGSILDNLLLARPEAPLADIEQALKVAQLQAFVSKLPEGLDTHIGEKGLQLSGGQRQKLCLARALLSNAPILVLDEATSNLDAESEREFQMALEAAWKGKTTFVVAHRIATVQKANQICVLDGGCIIESGTHAELLASGGIYADYCAG